MIKKVKAFSLTLAGIGLLLLGISAYLDRYEISAARSAVYRLDKRTGEVCLVGISWSGPRSKVVCAEE